VATQTNQESLAQAFEDLQNESLSHSFMEQKEVKYKPVENIKLRKEVVILDVEESEESEAESRS
jgi:hypothetical protein